MKHFVIKRASIPKVGVFGTVYDEHGNVICNTVEREWNDNKPFVSCIQNGGYLAKPHRSPKYADCYILINHNLGVGMYEGEHERYGILIHKANWPEQLQGCIAPVSYHGVVEGKFGGGNSGAAYDSLMEAFDGEEVMLMLTDEGIY